MTIVPVKFGFFVSALTGGARRVSFSAAINNPTYVTYHSNSFLYSASLYHSYTTWTLNTTTQRIGNTYDDWTNQQIVPLYKNSAGSFTTPLVTCQQENDVITVKFAKLNDSLVVENVITDAQIVMDGDTPTLVLTRENITMTKQ